MSSCLSLCSLHAECDLPYYFPHQLKDIKKAQQEFKHFSTERDESGYMDEEDGAVRTLEKGRVYLEEYVKEKLVMGKQGRTNQKHRC